MPLNRRKCTDEQVFSFKPICFPWGELGSAPAGSIFTDQDVDILEVIVSGGQYTEISPWSGLYSFDPAVIEALKAQGYTWTPYYSGKHILNLADTARFNNRGLVSEGLRVGAGERIEMRNMETDLLGGIYEIYIRLSGLQSVAGSENPSALFNVLGEAGDRVLYEEHLFGKDFDENGTLYRTFNCNLGTCPKVFFSVETAKDVSMTIEEFTWLRILVD